MKALLLTMFLLGLSAQAIPSSTAQVWQRHIDAWNARDLSAIVADYDEDAVVIINNERYEGHARIRSLFQGLFARFDQATRHEIDPAVIFGKVVYITWRATIGGQAIVGTDTFVMEEGRITYQTIASSPGVLE